MKTLMAKDAKYSFGRLIYLAHAEPVKVAMHGMPVVEVMAEEESERLMAFETDGVDNHTKETLKAN